MKYLFFLMLLTNIVFFLWEINGGLNTNDSQGELFHAEREKLILLLSEIDSVVTTENISARIQSILGSSATDQEQLPEAQRTDVEMESDLDVELIQEQESSETSGIETVQSVIIEKLPEDTEADQKVSSTTETRGIPEVKQNGALEENTAVESVAQSGITPAVEQEQQDEAENWIAQLFNQKPDQLPEQEKKQLNCYEMGPFADEAVLRQWRDQLDGPIEVLETLSREVEEIKDFMVYYPAAETLEQSKQNVSMLRRLGINDLWLFLEGDMRGAISLGLFQSQSIAEKARDRYRKDGLDVQIAPRYKKVQRHFVRLEMESQQQEKVRQLTSDRNIIALSACSGNQQRQQ